MSATGCPGLTQKHQGTEWGLPACTHLPELYGSTELDLNGIGLWRGLQTGPLESGRFPQDLCLHL